MTASRTPDTTESGQARLHAALCAWLLSMAVIWHCTSSSDEVWQYWLHFDPVHTPLIILICVSALISACFPTNSALFGLFALVGLAAFTLRMPWVPTHLLMEIILFLGVAFCFIRLGIREKTLLIAPEKLFDLYAPLARWLLITMYFYGTFHKLNPAFLSLESSCALPYIRELPVLSSFADSLPVKYAAIYGTLIVEFIAMLMLLTARFKYYGMLLDISFHFLIGISGYGTLAHFSTLALGLHGFFLPRDSVSRFLGDTLIPAALKSAKVLVTLTVLVVMLEFLFARMAWWGALNVLYASYALPFMMFVFRYGKPVAAQQRAPMLSSSWAINALSVLFVLNCAAPYFGLRTTAAVQMFSGLRTEGGYANHYLVGRGARIFDYQDDVIEIIYSNDPYFQYLRENRLGIVRFKFQRYLLEEAKVVALPLVIAINGRQFTLNTPEDFQGFAQEYFQTQSALEKFYLNFRDVDLEPPKVCRH